MSNLNDDLLDDGLQGLMGKERCQDLWGDKKASVSKKETVEAVGTSKMDSPKRVEHFQASRYEPAPHAPTQLEKLKAAAKSALLYAALSLLLFYFQQSGQMAMSASMPCILTCVALAGYGVGKSFAGGM